MRPFLLSLLVVLSLPLLACERVLLDERFYDKRLLNWTVVDDPDTVEGPSKWVVESDDWLHQRSNIWGRRGDFLGRWYGSFILAGDPRWDDYKVTLKAKASDDDGFGIILRCQDTEHFYRLMWIKDGFNGGPLTRLDKRDGPDYTELWSAPKSYKLNAEMAIEAEVIGDRIRATVDGERLFEATDGSYRRGKIGLFCYAQNGQAFGDVKVVSR